MDPQVEVEIKERPNSYLVIIKATGQQFEVSKNFGLTLLKRLILMKYPTAVFLHKTTPAMVDYGENFHSGAKK